MPVFEFAERLKQLPPYLFKEIDRVKDEVRARGVDIIDLGVGDPDLPTPGLHHHRPCNRRFSIPAPIAIPPTPA